ncbi:hypothetical protein KKG41_01050, partial [Patescibacteria group bacterium]|nr:hypothetical protein [Patescibacteria group bacterium]
STTAISGDDVLGTDNNSIQVKTQYLAAPEVWVDDDYYNGGYNDGHIWGYDAFDDIQNGIDNVTDNGVVHVKAGVYSVFNIIDRNDLLIEGFNGAVPISRGHQIVWDMAAAQYIRVIILINNSKDIIITGFEFQGVDLSGRSVGVFFQLSSGFLVS